MISVVIPSYNRRDCVVALLREVFAQQAVDFEVIVVDDCSPDDRVETFRREFPQAKIFVNEKNGGPAVTRNRGIREAKGDLIVGLDSDVTIPDVRLLLKVANRFNEHPQVDGLAFRLLKPDGKSEDTPRWWHPVPIDKYADKQFYTSYFSGTAYAFRREALVTAALEYAGRALEPQNLCTTRALIACATSSPDIANEALLGRREAFLDEVSRYLERQRVHGRLTYDNLRAPATQFQSLVCGPWMVSSLYGAMQFTTPDYLRASVDDAVQTFLRRYAVCSGSHGACEFCGAGRSGHGVVE